MATLKPAARAWLQRERERAGQGLDRRRLAAQRSQQRGLEVAQQQRLAELEGQLAEWEQRYGALKEADQRGWGAGS